MSIIEKKVYSDRFNIYFFNKNIFYQRETDSEIKRRFLWFKWTTPKIQDKKQRMNQYGITQTQKKTVEKMLMIS